MKIKRILAVLMVLVIMAAFAGCQSKADKEKQALLEEYKDRPEMKYINAGVEIPFKDLKMDGYEINIAAVWEQTPHNEQADRVAYLEEKYDCKINFVTVPYSDMLARLKTSVEAKKPEFDIMYVDSPYVPMLATGGYLQDIDKIEAFNFTEKKWSPTPLKVGVFDKIRYTFTLDMFQPRIVVVWNKTMFEKNGWGNLYELVEKNEWNWDNMLKIAQKAVDQKAGRSGILGYAFMQSQMVLSNNANLVSVDENGKPSFAADSENAMEAFQFLMDLNKKYQVMFEPDSPTWDTYATEFKEGRTAMAYLEAYQLDSLEGMVDKFGMVPPPMGPKSDRYVSRMGNLPLQVMAANNPKLQEVGYILDLYNEPFPGGQEDDWRGGLESKFSDDISIDYYKKIADEYSEFDHSTFYLGAKTLIENAVNDVWYGDKTLAESLGAIKNSASEILDDTYNGWKE